MANGSSLVALVNLLALSLIAPSCAASCKDAPPLNVVRMDEREQGFHRLFVQESPKIVEKVLSRQGAQRYADGVKSWIMACKPDWGDKWGLSVFSDAKYAGYKDDKKIEQYLKDGTWPHQYLVEYDNSSGTLTIYPVLPAKRATHKLREPKK